MNPMQPMQPQMPPAAQAGQGYPQPQQGYAQPAFDPNAAMQAAQQAMSVAPVGADGVPAVNLNATLSQIDFNQVEDKNYMTLDDRIEYEWAVLDLKGKRSSTGDDMIEVQLAVSHPKTLPNGQPCLGAMANDNISFSPKAAWKLKSFLKACGLLGPDGRFSGTSIEQAKGCVIRSGIRNESYTDANGNTTVRSKPNGRYTEGFETEGLNTSAPQQSYAQPQQAYAQPQQGYAQPQMPAPQMPQTPMQHPQPMPQPQAAPQMPAQPQAAPQMPAQPQMGGQPQPEAQAPQMPQMPQMPPMPGQ